LCVVILINIFKKGEHEKARTRAGEFSTIALYETGDATPKLDGVVAIADYFGVSVDYLLGRAPIKAIDVNAQGAAKEWRLTEEAVETLKTLASAEELKGEHAMLNAILACGGATLELLDTLIQMVRVGKTKNEKKDISNFTYRFLNGEGESTNFYGSGSRNALLAGLAFSICEVVEGAVGDEYKRLLDS